MTVMWQDDEIRVVRFSVHGDPVAQGSKRHVGGGVMVESAKNLKPWRQEVVAAAREVPMEDPLLGPVRVDIRFRFRRLDSHFGTGKNAATLKSSAPDYKKTKPDLDKLARAILDAIVTAGVLRDDAQVAVLVCEKRYAPTPGAVVEIRPLS